MVKAIVAAVAVAMLLLIPSCMPDNSKARSIDKTAAEASSLIAKAGE